MANKPEGDPRERGLHVFSAGSPGVVRDRSSGGLRKAFVLSAAGQSASGAERDGSGRRQLSRARETERQLDMLNAAVGRGSGRKISSFRAVGSSRRWTTKSSYPARSSTQSKSRATIPAAARTGTLSMTHSPRDATPRDCVASRKGRRKRSGAGFPRTPHPFRPRSSSRSVGDRST